MQLLIKKTATSSHGFRLVVVSLVFSVSSFPLFPRIELVCSYSAQSVYSLELGFNQDLLIALCV